MARDREPLGAPPVEWIAQDELEDFPPNVCTCTHALYCASIIPNISLMTVFKYAKMCNDKFILQPESS